MCSRRPDVFSQAFPRAVSAAQAPREAGGEDRDGADDGVFFGSTILDTGAHHTRLCRALNSLYTGPITLFHNRGNDLDGLHTVLTLSLIHI